MRYTVSRQYAPRVLEFKGESRVTGCGSLSARSERMIREWVQSLPKGNLRAVGVESLAQCAISGLPNVSRWRSYVD